MEVSQENIKSLCHEPTKLRQGHSNLCSSPHTQQHLPGSFTLQSSEKRPQCVLAGRGAGLENNWKKRINGNKELAVIKQLLTCLF